MRRWGFFWRPSQPNPATLPAMTGPQTCFAEQDPTVARVAEASLRMMAGTVSPATRRRTKELAAAAAGGYPWDAVVTAVLADPIDPSVLVQKGLTAQRDWVVKTAAAGAPASPAPRSGPALSYRIKRLLAVSLARLMFYALFTLCLLTLLVLVRKALPWADLYALTDQGLEFVRSLFR